MPRIDSPSLDSICYSLEQAGRAAGRDRAAVFGDWLDYATAVLQFQPAADAIRDRLDSGTGLLEAIDLSDAFNDTTIGTRLARAYSAAEEGSWESTVTLFRAALETALIQSATPVNGVPFVEAHDIDLFGLIYQGWVFPCTPLELIPYSTARQIARAVVPDGGAAVFSAINEALDTLERHDAISAIMARAGLKLALEYAEQRNRAECERVLSGNVLPMIRGHLSPVVVVDPACGSGTMLLAASTRFPAFAVEAGAVAFVGFDIDPLCVQMARLNEVLHGFNGYFTASVNGTPLPASLIGSALSLPELPIMRSLCPAGLFPIVEAAQAADNPDTLRGLAADARRLTTAQAMSVALGR